MPVTFTVHAKTAEWTFEEHAGKVTGTTVHLVRTSEPTSPAVASTAPDLPTASSPYPDTLAVAYRKKRKTKAVDDTRTLFRVECDFDGTAGTLPTSPFNVPTSFSYSSESVEETYYMDETTPTAKRAVNTANQPFAELPKRERSIRVIEIGKNVPEGTTFASLDNLMNKTNSAVQTLDGTTYAAGTLRVVNVSLSEVKTDGLISYREQRVTVKANPDKWDQKFESLGLESADTDTGFVWPIVDPETGSPVTEPWPLNSEGVAQVARSVAGDEIVLKPYKATSLTGIA